MALLEALSSLKNLSGPYRPHLKRKVTSLSLFLYFLSHYFPVPPAAAPPRPAAAV